MRGRTALLTMVTLAVAGTGVARTDLVHVPEALLAPVYDVTTQSSARTLAVALQSYALFEPSFEGLTPEALGEWGWEPTDTAAVTIWVQGGTVRAVLQDVRPGATAYALVQREDGSVSAEPVTGSASLDPQMTPGVTIRTAGTL